MIHVLWSKLKHSPGRFLLLFSTLLLAMVFLIVAVQLYLQTDESMENIEARTTTIAFIQSDLEETEFDMDTMSLQKIMRSTAYRRKAERFESVIGKHAGTTRLAYAPSLIPAIPSLQLQAARSSSRTTIGVQNIGVFRVHVDSIEAPSFTSVDSVGHMTLDGQRMDFTSQREYDEIWVNCTLLETIHLHPECVAPSITLRIQCFDVVNPDGTFLFETGKEYIVIGEYFLPEVRLDQFGKIKINHFFGSPAMEVSAFMVYPDRTVSGSYPMINGKPYYHYFYDDGSMYQATALPEAFPLVLEADDPRVDSMVNWAVKCSNMFPITGISTVKALPLFAMDKAYIAEGRDINKQDNDEKNNVCLVSTAFAEYNGLHIGDRVSLELYDQQLFVNGDGSGSTSYSATPYLGSMEAYHPLSYEIVGIYKTQDFVNGRMHFPTNTLFVPETTLPREIYHEEDDKTLYFASSMILKNGSMDQFRQEAEDAGIPDNIFALHDGGYTQYMKTLRTMKKDTGVVLAVAAMLFVVLCTSSLYMMTMHLRKEKSMMLRIGATQRYGNGYMLLCTLPWVIAAALAAYGVSCLAYPSLMKALEKLYIVSRPMFSNLSKAQLGMLTTTGSAYPSPAGAVFALAAGICCCVLLVYAGKERRVTK